jgi:exodeoxyribonuclease-3
MKIISWNVNGIRSVYRKGFSEWLEKYQPDIVALQEIKACPEEIPQVLVENSNYNLFVHSAQKKGYSGVVFLSKKKPKRIKKDLGLKQFDQEGRGLFLEFPEFILINLYLPHGGRKKEKLDYKMKVYNFLIDYLSQIKNRKIILTGDFNIAHQEIDLARTKENKNSIMFTPQERERITAIIEMGFSDSFRQFHPDEKKYSWWPYFANARARNLGWRIDYIFSSNSLESQLKKAFILNEVMGSDHCPIGIEI